MYNHHVEKGCTLVPTLSIYYCRRPVQMDFSYNNYSTVCYVLRHRLLRTVGVYNIH